MARFSVPVLSSVLSVLALGALLGACDEKEEFFHDCPLSQTLIAACKEQSETAEVTCAVRAHPMCDEAVCAQWRGSDGAQPADPANPPAAPTGFCSRECDGDGDCPAGSSCQPYLDLDDGEFKFCVPDAVNTVAP